MILNWKAAILLGLAPLLGGCVYFNTFFNAEKAYHQALRMREKRLNKNPEDTIALANEEKLKLERSISKCSKVLELYPEKLQYAPKALFLMGESYLIMGEHAKAVAKYEELQRYYPRAEEIPLAEVHRAKGLFLEGQNLKAQASLEDILKRNPTGPVRREALLLAAQMQIEGNSKAAALGFYEKLLDEKGLNQEERAEARWQAARLAFDLEQWEKARRHALAGEKNGLATRHQYRNEKLALTCQYRQRKFREGIAEAEGLSQRKGYAPFRAELRLLLAQGFAGAGDWIAAARLYREVPPLAPKTAFAAEAFYRLGDHWLNVAHREDSARIYFDSAAAAGATYEFGRLGAEKAEALSRLGEMRKAPAPDSTRPHSQDFMIAELFLFRLSQVDSALSRLDGIVRSPKSDTEFTVRAAYARAFIQEEFRQDTVKSDSLYRFVLEQYPGTEWAKQAEKNLGLKPTVETEDDKAHVLFSKAETLRFGGEDLPSKVIPAYGEVVTRFPRSRYAAQALFVIAWLHEDLAHRDAPVVGSLDSAKADYLALKSRYPGTPYAGIAVEKLAAAGITGSAPAPAVKPAVSPAPAAAAPANPHEIPATPGIAAPPASTATDDAAAPADTSDAAKRHKEVLEPSYDNVDQY